MATVDPFRDKAPPAPLDGSMFGNYSAAQHKKAPPWAAPVLIGAVALHVILFVAMWVKTIWQLDQLDKPKSTIDLAGAPPPRPPPAAAAPAPTGWCEAARSADHAEEKDGQGHRPADQDGEAGSRPV